MGLELASTILDALPIGVYVANRAAAFYCNRAGARLLGTDVAPGTPLEALAAKYALYRTSTNELYPAEQLPLVRALAGEPCSADDIELRRPTPRRLTMHAEPLLDHAGHVQLAIATLVDTLDASQSPPSDGSTQAPSSTRHGPNLEVLGQLAAGVAHEINTPMQYIGDNSQFLGITVRRLLEMAGTFERLLAACRSGTAITDQLLSDCERELNRGRLDFLRDQAPTAIEQTQAGIDQVRSIVQALKEFSHPGEDEPTLVDVNHLAKMASTVTRNAWRYVAELNLELCDCPRAVRGYPQEIGQVLINLIVNAAHAVEERGYGQGDQPLGKISIRTSLVDDMVVIQIQDNGAGIPEAIRHRIMSPFFTTKPVGKGTGQGLSLAQQVIVERHHGSLTFESQVGHGTTFCISLPGCADE
jgi:signal transduction histidine kinase